MPAGDCRSPKTGHYSHIFFFVSGGFGNFVSDGYGGSYGNFGGSYTQVDWWGN